MWAGRSAAGPVAVDRSKDVSVTADVTDMSALQAVKTKRSPELAAAMDRHGVIPPLTAHVEK